MFSKEKNCGTRGIDERPRHYIEAWLQANRYENAEHCFCQWYKISVVNCLIAPQRRSSYTESP
jgi:hypothetical protein